MAGHVQSFKNRLKFIALITGILAFTEIACGQDPTGAGYLVLPDSSDWLCIVDDSLTSIENYPILPVQSGSHFLKILPKNSRNWLDRGYWFDTGIDHHSYRSELGVICLKTRSG